MKISIVGTGNVAFHLGKRLVEKGLTINQVIGRDEAKTRWLSEILQAKQATFAKNIDESSDLFIIAVSDTAIEEVAKKLSEFIDKQCVVHTSGSIPSTILQPYFKHFGVLYPLQTFSLTSQPDFDKIPIFINNTPQYYIPFLKNLAEKISPRVYELPDEDRMTLHVAAVFVNNFTNHLFKIGSEILAKQNLPFDVLLPLIEETVNKIRHNPPLSMQTGPAKRGDNVTVEKHLAFLEQQAPQYDLLYTLLSISINPDLKINK
ncbi:MAG: DUF2520 domain-containing protein [Saprospiraceae bacterium]|nr:DUF2520 domain-containing protein [Saprospiraceae bacterium]